jgi:predicted TIM-barrel fold metal-dependent hydrolase
MVDRRPALPQYHGSHAGNPVTMAIDMHAHYLPPDMADMLRKRKNPPRLEQVSQGIEKFHRPQGSYDFNPAYSDIRGRMELLDRTGVQTQILSLPGLMGIDSLPLEESAPLLRLFNDELSGLCRRYPDRFVGLAALPMADIDAAEEELRRGVQELGFIGAILPVNFFTSPAEAKKLALLFEIGQQFGLYFFIHPGWRPDEAPSPADELAPQPQWKGVMPMGVLELQTQITRATVTLLFSDFLGCYPDVSVHVANLGGTCPILVERMNQISKILSPGEPPLSGQAHRIYVDCASLGPRAIEMAAAVFGADNILFGSDTPTFGIEWSLSAIRDANITDDDRKGILERNAQALLRQPLAGASG